MSSVYLPGVYLWFHVRLVTFLITHGAAAQPSKTRLLMCGWSEIDTHQRISEGGGGGGGVDTSITNLKCAEWVVGNNNNRYSNKTNTNNNNTYGNITTIRIKLRTNYCAHTHTHTHT